MGIWVGLSIPRGVWDCLFKVLICLSRFQTENKQKSVFGLGEKKCLWLVGKAKKEF